MKWSNAIALLLLAAPVLAQDEPDPKPKCANVFDVIDVSKPYYVIRLTTNAMDDRCPMTTTEPAMVPKLVRHLMLNEKVAAPVIAGTLSGFDFAPAKGQFEGQWKVLGPGVYVMVRWLDQKQLQG